MKNAKLKGKRKEKNKAKKLNITSKRQKVKDKR